MKDYGSTRNPNYPYQCFMGRWEGLTKTFDPQGNYLGCTPVHMDCYWVAPNVWHMDEEFDTLWETQKRQMYNTDFLVECNTTSCENALVKVMGVMLTSYNYNFVIDSAVSKSLVLNNHYFLDPDTRRIITHKMRDGKTTIFQIQDFVRVVRP